MYEQTVQGHCGAQAGSERGCKVERPVARVEVVVAELLAADTGFIFFKKKKKIAESR